MKIIHCSDLHLDSALGSNFSPEKAKQRQAELCATFARMVRFAVREQVRAILIAGDLFDGAYVSVRTANFVTEQIRGAKDITFFYLRGNHDENHVFTNGDKPDNLKTFGPRWESCRLDSVVITAMEPEGSLWQEMYGLLKLKKEDLNIVMLHGQTATMPEPEKIALPLLQNKNIRYLALGHLHGYRKGRLDPDGEYCYCGTPEGRGFDECGEKGFVLLETDGDRLRSSFIPFASRVVHEVYADITGAETVTQILSRMKDAACGIKADDLVKFVLTGNCTLQSQKDLSFLQTMLEPDFWFVKIKDESSLRLDRENYEYDVSLKGEFVRAVMASDYSETEKMRMINCGIRALGGEEVLL